MSDPEQPGSPAPTVRPTLRARDAEALIRFLVDVLGFREAVVYRSDDANEVNHAELAWPPGGGIMLGSARESDAGIPALQPGSASAYLVCEDATAVDAVHARAIEAAATVLLAPYDTDYGSHECAIADPEGNRWAFGTYPGHPGG